MALTPLERMLQIDVCSYWESLRDNTHWDYSGVDGKDLILIRKSEKYYGFHQFGANILSEDRVHFSMWSYE